MPNFPIILFTLFLLSVNCFKNSAEPDFAMVPISFIISSLFIPIPVSDIVNVFFFSSKLIFISNGAFLSIKSVPLVDSKRSLSKASEAFEINSRKNISLVV